MDISPLWLLLPVAVAFALGWAAARIDVWQLRRSPDDSPRAYFQGLNFLLNEQQDKAIDAFIEAVRADPQTVELQFALGNLFRRRGEFERSVRVHQSLLQRSDLPQRERERAQFELANDYMRAGLLDRAEQAYAALKSGRFAVEAQRALLVVAERSKDWLAAIAAAESLEREGAGSMRRWIAQYRCELAQLAYLRQDAEAALAELDRALQANAACVRALLLRGDWHAERGDHAAALDSWSRIEQVASEFIGLAARRVARLPHEYRARQRLLLERWLEQQPSAEILDALSTVLDDDHERRAVTERFLLRHRSLAAARRLLAMESGTLNASIVQALDRALEHAQTGISRYRCASCGFEARSYYWQCPACQAWETYPPRRADE
jgi:lipopolysaccharide biosynthesis regulator YciM